MGGRTEPAHPNGARCPPRAGSMARAPCRVDEPAARPGGAGPRRPPDHARARGGGTAVTSRRPLAGRSDWRSDRARRPGRGGRRRSLRSRLVLRLAARRAGRVRRQRGRHGELLVAGRANRRRLAADRRDPELPGMQRRLGSRRHRLLLHPLSGGRRVPPHGPPPRARHRLARRPDDLERPRSAGDVAERARVTRGSPCARRRHGRMGADRSARARP